MASAVQAAPWLIAVGRYKAQVFVAVGILLALNYWLAIVRPRRLNCAPGEPCHIDSPAMRVSRAMYWASLAVWIGAVTITYAALWWVRLRP